MKARMIPFALTLVAAATALGAMALYETTAITLGLFLGLGVPFYAAAAVLYTYEVLADLKRHGVL